MNIKIHYKLENMTQQLENDVKNLIENNLNDKLDRYLKKFDSHSEILLDVSIIKNKQDKYEGSIRLTGVLNGKNEILLYHTKEPFKNIYDVINHAFDHFKLILSDK